jgi:methionine-rich copper-binding protein CopC
MSNRQLRRLLVAIPAFVLLVCFPTIALAHADLQTASPADGTTVATTPAEVVMVFTEAVDPAKSSLRLVNASGAIVGQGSTVDSGQPDTMRLVLSPQPPGTYTVRWTTTALDGHVAHGTTAFTIAAPAPSPSLTSSVTAVSPAEPPSPTASVAAPSPSPSPSGGTGAPTTSTSDAVIPIVAAVIVLVALGVWLLGNRSRRAG